MEKLQTLRLFRAVQGHTYKMVLLSPDYLPPPSSDHCGLATKYLPCSDPLSHIPHLFFSDGSGRNR